MKTQSYGRTITKATALYVSWTKQHFSRSPLSVFIALKDYREQRENGDKRDEPKEAFPAAGLDSLDIRSFRYPGILQWPDKEGRYWWTLTCKDGREINDYYWKKDEVRGYPDKADGDRYWFSVHHAPSGTKIEGFSARPDREKGYPDKSGDYWSYIQYDECGPIKAWMEQKDKNYVARLQREKEAEQSKGSKDSLPIDIFRSDQEDGNTPLHMAIQRDQIELARKLIVHGAKVSAKNKMQETPLGLLIDKKQSYFSSEEKKQLLALMLSIKDFKLPDSFRYDFSRDIVKRRDAILKINTLFSRGAPSIVNRAVIPFRVGDRVNVKSHKKSFREMHKSPYLEPLLNIAAFAVEGLHHLGSRLSERDKKLKIVLGPYKDNEQTTTKVTLWTNRNAYGVYYHDNAIYLGGKRDKDDAKSRKLVRGTLVHEITHFVAHEVFDNLAIPYAKGDMEAQKKFSSICNRIQKLSLDTPNRVPEIIRRVFSYSKDYWHIELIVRVPQLIAMGELETVKEFCPDLLEYYESYFLKACQEHLLKLHYLNDVLLPSANAESISKKINTGKLCARISHIHFDEAGTLESDDEFGSASESDPEETDRNSANDDDSQCETVKVRVTRDYFAKKEGDLTIHQGDIINLVADEGDEWCRCEIDGKKGRVPTQCLALEFSAADSNVKSGESSNSGSIYGFWQRNRHSILVGISAAAVGFVALAQVYQGHQGEDDLNSIGRMRPGSLD